MNIYSKRRRARRLNDPNKTVEKDDPGDEVDPDDLELDYGGVVEKADDEAEKQERREELVKSLGSPDDETTPDFEEVFKNDDGDDPDLELDYSGITKSPAEKERERDAAAIGEAVADELERRGMDPDAETDTEGDEDGTDEEAVEKAGERTADLLDDVQDDLRGLKRARSVRTLLKNYVADGGDPEDTMDEVFEWYNQHSEASIKVEDGSVTVEDAAT
jgi:hypothetical protein